MAVSKHFLRRLVPASVMQLLRFLRIVLWPPAGAVVIRDYVKRIRFDNLLGDMFTSEQVPIFSGAVLVDAQWDNPNWWIRYQLLRSALGLRATKEVAIMGDYNKFVVRTTLNRMGIEDTSLNDFCTEFAKFELKAEILLKSVNASEDLLNLTLPNQIPSFVLYDWLLKRQMGATVNIAHPQLKRDVATALQRIDAAQQMFSNVSPNLVVLSHSVGIESVAIIAAALNANIPIIIGHGEYGILRYWKVCEMSDICYLANIPSSRDYDELSDDQENNLFEVGDQYIQQRLKGGSQDLGSRYAFNDNASLSRKNVHDEFGWSDDKPIIAVYSMSWFDYPHIYGDLWFTDPLDWISSTIKAISDNTSAHWLLRPHPCDEWYQALSLSDLVPQHMAPHIGLAPLRWNGSDVLTAVDGLVTLYGTAGIEYASRGKPVLVGAPGWYGQSGFVVCPNSRNEYLTKLRSRWWDVPANEISKRTANVFAGWHFCVPSWQENFVMKDDSEQGSIYSYAPGLLKENEAVVRREINTLRSWYLQNDVLGYHSFKMLNTDTYKISNIVV